MNEGVVEGGIDVRDAEHDLQTKAAAGVQYNAMQWVFRAANASPRTVPLISLPRPRALEAQETLPQLAA